MARHGAHFHLSLGKLSGRHSGGGGPFGSRRASKIIAIGSIAIALVIAANIAWFYLRSDLQGQSLVHEEQSRISASDHTSSPVKCAPFSDSNTTNPQGLVEASTIAMKAPVLGGDGDPQLDVAVGHVPGSSWPGQPGTTLLAAHDVTYFNHIDDLQTGATVSFVTPCATYNYKVVDSEIVQAGSPLYTSPSQDLLVLETCYPLNALYLTPQRFLVTAELTQTRPVGEPSTVSELPIPTVPAPAPLLAQGLTLATNDLPLGTLDEQGDPSLAWDGSTGPFDATASVLEEYFGALRSAEQNEQTWWRALSTPAADFGSAAPLVGANIDGYLSETSPVLEVQANSLTGAQVGTTVDLSGGSAPGRYQISAAMTVVHHKLYISKWTMTPA
jgi:sortase A